MINWNSILSSFDNKPTLLQWLKKVEKALKEGSLKNVSIEAISETQIKFKFTFADNTFIESGVLEIPNSGKIDAFDLLELIKPSMGIIADISEDNTQVELHLDQTFINSLATKNELQLLANEVNSNGDTLNSLIGRVDNLTDSKQDKLIVNTGEATTELKSLNIDNVNYKLGGGGGVKLIYKWRGSSNMVSFPTEEKEKIKTLISNYNNSQKIYGQFQVRDDKGNQYLFIRNAWQDVDNFNFTRNSTNATFPLYGVNFPLNMNSSVFDYTGSVCKITINKDGTMTSDDYFSNKLLLQDIKLFKTE